MRSYSLLVMVGAFTFYSSPKSVAFFSFLRRFTYCIRHIKIVNNMIRFCNSEIAKLKEEAKQLAQSVKDKVIKAARNLEQLRKNLLCIQTY